MREGALRAVDSELTALDAPLTQETHYKGAAQTHQPRHDAEATQVLWSHGWNHHAHVRSAYIAVDLKKLPAL